MYNRELMAALQRCTLHPLLIITSRILTREGFGDVQILDRRLSPEKSRFGGHEILCEGTFANRPTSVVVKVILDGVRTRMLDELAGTTDRRRADIGLLISPFPLSTKLRKDVQSYSKSRIEVIDGVQLALLAAKHKIGVRGGSVDYAFFGELEIASMRLLTVLREEEHGR